MATDESFSESTSSLGDGRTFSPIGYRALSKKFFDETTSSVSPQCSATCEPGTNGTPDKHSEPCALFTDEEKCDFHKTGDAVEHLQMHQGERDLYKAALENVSSSLAIILEELQEAANDTATRTTRHTRNDSSGETECRKHKLNLQMLQLLGKEKALAGQQEAFVNEEPDASNKSSGVVSGAHEALGQVQNEVQTLKRNITLQSKDYETTLDDLQTMIQKVTTMKEVAHVLHESNAQEKLKRKKLQREKNMLVKECRRLAASLKTVTKEKQILEDRHLAISISLHEQNLMSPTNGRQFGKRQSMNDAIASPILSDNKERRPSTFTAISRHENPPSIIFDGKSVDRDLETVTFGTLTPTLSLDDDDIDNKFKHAALAPSLFADATPTKISKNAGLLMHSVSQKIESMSPLSLQPVKHFQGIGGHRDRARTSSSDITLNLPALGESMGTGSMPLVKRENGSNLDSIVDAPLRGLHQYESQSNQFGSVDATRNERNSNREVPHKVEQPSKPQGIGAIRGFFDFVESQR